LLARFRTLEGAVADLPGTPDPEPVHQARVASRRARAALDTLGAVLPVRLRRALRSEVRALLKALGPARDLDVQALDVEGRLAGAPPRARAGLRRVHLRVAQRREALEGAVVAARDAYLAGEIGLRLEVRLAPFALHAPREGDRLPAEVFDEARQALAPRVAALRETVSLALADPAPEHLHAARIAGKRVRYTLEVLAPLDRRSVEELLPLVRGAQEILGRIHDDDVWLALLAVFAAEERARCLAHEGDLAGFLRLVPGLQYLESEHATSRSGACAAWAALVAQLEADGTWSHLETLFPIPEEP
jgi:CHAD domain-containing protein